MPIETVAAEQWLFATLSADSALAAVVGTRIFTDVAPVDSVFPLVIFQLQAPGDDLNGVGARRLLASGVYVVKVIGRTLSIVELQAAADRIDAVLHAKQGAAGSAQIVACVRERPFRLSEVIDGQTYKHLGGFYRVQVKQ